MITKPFFFLYESNKSREVYQESCPKFKIYAQINVFKHSYEDNVIYSHQHPNKNVRHTWL